MNRRSFIKGAAGLGAVSVLPGCTLSGLCGSLVRADLAGEAEGSGPVAGLEPQEAEILAYASLAPSGHNAQPWFVKILEPGRWLIGLDRDRLLPAVDPENRESLLSLGAFVENLVLAAGALGRPVRVEILDDRPLEEGFVRVSLGRAQPSGYPLERLTSRRTVKHGFGPEPLKPEHLKVLQEILGSRVHYFPRGSEHSDCIAQGTAEAFRIQTARDEVMEEMAVWTRFGNRAAHRHRDGLTPAGMEIGGLAGFYVRNFMDPQDVMGKRFRDSGVEMTAKLAKEGGGWLILTGGSGSPREAMEMGRLFERMALRLREMTLAVHPMTQMLEEESGREAIRANHADPVSPQFILRVGYLKQYPDPVSLRRPVGWFARI